jgi:type IV pilus assembly protein PilV
MQRFQQQGSMLLEALIAVTIFSIGLLGVIGMQATAINSTLDARFRTDSAFLANQIISQMWVDPDTTNPSALVVKSTYACNPCTSANGNANTRAWLAQIQGTSAVPGFLPSVTDAANQPFIAVSGTQVTVTLNWVSPQSASSVHNYTTTTEIQFN